MSSRQLRQYESSESVAFRSTKGQFGGLSNMAPGFPLNINGIRILTSEALYQACRFPSHPDIQRLVIEQTSPMTSKMKAKSHSGESRQDWLSVRVAVMRWCLRVKLAQNWERFGDLLLSTGSVPIVEDSAKDPFWGARATDVGTFEGVNALGRLLMELREGLRENPDSLRFVLPPKVPNFCLLGRPIGTVEREPAGSGT